MESQCGICHELAEDVVVSRLPLESHLSSCIVFHWLSSTYELSFQGYVLWSCILQDLFDGVLCNFGECFMPILFKASYCWLNNRKLETKGPCKFEGWQTLRNTSQTTKPSRFQDKYENWCIGKLDNLSAYFCCLQPICMLTGLMCRGVNFLSTNSYA